MSKSNNVATFHEMAGQPVNNKPTLPDLKAIRFRQHFLLEEVIEGFEALLKDDSRSHKLILNALKAAQHHVNMIENSEVSIDFEEFLDHLVDIEYVLHGTAHYYGLPLEKAFDEVHSKNMTRFPATEEDLKATVSKASGENVPTTSHYNEKHQRWAVIRDDNGKLYKNANFIEPDFSQLL